MNSVAKQQPIIHSAVLKDENEIFNIQSKYWKKIRCDITHNIDSTTLLIPTSFSFYFLICMYTIEQGTSITSTLMPKKIVGDI